MKRNSIFMVLLAALLSSCNSTPHYATYNDYPVYEGSDLELSYTPESSKFRVWAPTADEVKVLFYDNGYEGGAYKMLDMERSDKGTWTLKVNENLKGKFYTFQVKIGEKWLDETPGMWVKARNLPLFFIPEFGDTEKSRI